MRAEARDDSISAVTRVSCQRAAAGMPKCAICDRVCHAIIPCTAATDDENMSGAHDTAAAAGREHAERGRRAAGHSFIFRGPAESGRKAHRARPVIRS